MSNIKIILTLDYEIFGNGSGDVRSCLIYPTKKLLSVANKYGIPITIFLEIGELLAFEKEFKEGVNIYGYNPAEEIKEQLIEAIKNGHDVQLHLHPQWLDYKYEHISDEWSLNLSLWRTSSLSYDELVNIFRTSKEKLEKLIKNFNEKYECFVFRAGAWSIQPEVNVIKALLEAGYRIDSSAIKGAYFKGKFTYYDFSDLPNKPFWYSMTKLNKEDKSGILELPIMSVNLNLLDRIICKINRYKKQNDLNQKPLGCKGTFLEDIGSSKRINKWQSILRTFDYCGVHYSDMIYMIKKIKKKYRNFEILPIVGIGHSKTFNSDFNFEKFIVESIKNGFQFNTFNQIESQISNYNSSINAKTEKDFDD